MQRFDLAIRRHCRVDTVRNGQIAFIRREVTVFAIKDVANHRLQNGIPACPKWRKPLRLRLRRETSAGGFTNKYPQYYISSHERATDNTDSTCCPIYRKSPTSTTTSNAFEEASTRIHSLPQYRNENKRCQDPRKCAVSLPEPREFPLQKSDITQTAKPNYKLLIS